MDYDYKGIALIPIVTMLVDVLKRAGLPTKYAPLVSIILGVIFAIVFQNNGDIKGSIITGLVIGTSASGLYSGGKEAYKGMMEMKNKDNHID